MVSVDDTILNSLLWEQITNLALILSYRTTKTGGYPNISVVLRKPRWIGTEFKCFVDSVLRVMLYIEIQEGKVRMSKKGHFRQLGATASCVMRAVDAGKKFSSFYDSGLFYSSKEENGAESSSDESSDSDSTVTDDSQTKMPALKDPPTEAPKVTPEKINDNEPRKVSPKATCM